MLRQSSIPLRFVAALLVSCAMGTACCDLAAAQDWRAERGRTWRDDPSYRGVPPAQSAPRPAIGPTYNPVPGYGIPGYGYNGPAYDKYVTDSNPSSAANPSPYVNNTNGPPPAPKVDTGVSSCPQRTDTSAPSTQTYFGSDGARHPCP